MNVKQAKLLLILADEVESQERFKKNGAKFDMGVFYNGEPTDANPSTGYPPCGSACCAIGLCPFIPALATAGWSYDRYNRPVFQEENGFYAAARAFGLSYDEAYSLFTPATVGDPPGHDAPKAVAERLRGAVRKLCPEAIPEDVR